MQSSAWMVRLILISCALTGCASGTGVDGFDTSAPVPGDRSDEPGPISDAPREPCLEYPSNVNGDEAVGFRDFDQVPVIGYQIQMPESDFEVYLWQDYEFELGYRAGTFGIRLEPFCTVCAGIFEDGRVLQARSGTLVIEEVTDTRLRGTALDLELVEIDPIQMRPINGGCSASVSEHSFDVAIPAP